MARMVLEANEVITLILVLFGYITVWFTYHANPRLKVFFMGYTALVIGVLATNLEAILWPTFFNLLEHAGGIMGAGIIFSYFAYQHYHQDQFLRKKLEEMDR